MKKFLIVLLVVLVLLGGGVFYVASQAGDIIRTAVVEYGPEITGTPVTLDSVSLSLLLGNAKINNLVIGNPDGFKSEDAVRVGVVEVQLDVNSLFGDAIHIQKILVDGAELTYELAGGGSNIDALKRNVEERTAALLGSGDEADASAEESTTALIIDDLFVNNTKVKVVAKLLGGKGASVTIADIHMEDIGKEEGGSSAAEVVNKLVAIITKSATGSVGQILSTDQLKGAVDDAVTDQVKGVSDKLKGLFSK